jgi:hypothetical protein
MSQLKYENMHTMDWTDAEIWEFIKEDDIEALIRIPIKMGFNHLNWRFTQQICAILSEHENETVRANSFFGLGYTAMTRKSLDKNVVKPLFLRGLNDPSELVRSNAQDMLEMTNQYMGWKIGSAASNKAREKAYYEKHKPKTH